MMQHADVEFFNATEFGLELFDAIKLCGGVEQMRHLRESAKMRTVKPGQLTEWQQREKELIEKLLVIIQKLSDDDAGDLARRYKWVARI